MLLAFSEQTKGQKFPVNASDQKMLEIVMDRWSSDLGFSCLLLIIIIHSTAIFSYAAKIVI